MARFPAAALLAAVLLAVPPAAAAPPTTPLCLGRHPTVTGTPIDDLLRGTPGDDVIWAGGGNDRIEAGPGRDLVCAGPGDDTVAGEEGPDTLLGGDGADHLDGGPGDDALLGGPGNDRLLGGDGADYLSGADGQDTISGGPGTDTLVGGPEDDDLYGEEDADTCQGGAGWDFADECAAVRATEEGEVPQVVTAPGPNQVALTFDDGPAYTYTEQILAILDRYDVPATFFVVGLHAAREPDMVRRYAAEGHSVQNHTYGHYRLTEYSDAEVQDQLDRTDRLVFDLTGIAPRCMRPPYGAVDDRVRSLAAGLGLATVMWQVDPSDWAHPAPQVLISRVLDNTGGGDIVDLHDMGGQNTIAALPAIIEGLRARGLEFVALCTPPDSFLMG